MTTEKELRDFIKDPNNKESETLEYKIKPNFNEIENSIKEITNRMHFNILKTIYAFANTEGGKLYIGIKELDQKRTINNGIDNSDKKTMAASSGIEPPKWLVEGIDESDKKIVEGILQKVDSIIKKEDKDIPLKNGRIVMEIKVSPLKIYDKPLFVDGILYVRKNDKTEKVKSLKDNFSLYEDRQLYMCYEKGIKSNLKKIAEQNKHFEVQPFIEGLKIHIKSLIEKHEIKEYEAKLQKAESLLDQIKDAILKICHSRKSGNPEKKPQNSKSDTSIERSEIHLNLDSLIDKFIGIYKEIISKG